MLENRVILAGDVGGTKTDLALFDPGPPLRLVRLETFRTGAFPSLEEMIGAFLRDGDLPLAAATLGVAGPIVRGTAVLPNVSWNVDARRIATRIGLAVVTLLNDLEASAWAVEVLGSADAATVLAGAPDAAGHQAVIAAGTGLGEAVLLRVGGRRIAVSTEAGHADFAPRTDLEIELLRWLRRRFGHVSWERVLSGPGLVNVHTFLAESGGGAEPPSVTEAIRAGDAAAEIAAAALAGRSERCALALDVFTSAYGAEAGNLVLRALATGGVFLGGGIAPKILPWLLREPFRAAFIDKGRLSPMVAATPVRAILDERAAVIGAARRATEGLLA
ncbi:MAG TPA: glucokinase [Anaeromyxobacter sp.]